MKSIKYLKVGPHKQSTDVGQRSKDWEILLPNSGGRQIGYLHAGTNNNKSRYCLHAFPKNNSK